MTNAVSRLLVAAAALPVVLGAVYVGGWWLFALVTVGALIALHEYWLLTRRLSPRARTALGGNDLRKAADDASHVISRTTMKAKRGTSALWQ